MKMSRNAKPVSSRELLRNAGLRVTSSRLRVMEVLRSASSPLSHADVAAELESHGLDRTTVYRNLVDLAEAGILRRSAVGQVFRFELVAHERGEHAAATHPHFVCTDCGQVACLPVDSIAIKASRRAPSALKHGKLEIQVRGQCDACS